MPNKVDFEHLEENIKGCFFSFLERGGVDVENLDALARVKHNTFDCALMAVFEKLFKPEKNQPNNQRSLLPYNDNIILQQLVDIYFKLCNLTDNDSTLQGFERLTGFDYVTLARWEGDELNPERCAIVKSIVKNRQGMIENKLSDHPIGATALANNSESLGLKWAVNSAPKISSVTAFVLPGEGVRQALEQRMNAGALPKSADNASIINE